VPPGQAADVRLTPTMWRLLEVLLRRELAEAGLT
jgi:hypothetical protein